MISCCAAISKLGSHWTPSQLLSGANKHKYRVGGNINLQLTNKITVDGVQATMPADYPKLQLQGENKGSHHIQTDSRENHGEDRAWRLRGSGDPFERE